METRYIKAVVFDFHATLAYKERSVGTMDVVEILREAGHDIGPQEWEGASRYVFFIDFPKERFRNWNEYRGRIFERLGIESTNELGQELENLYTRGNMWKLYPEVPEVIDRLRKDFVLGIATTIPSFQVEPILGELASHFGFIGTGDTVGRAKGSRSFYLTIARELNATPQESLFVGDDLNLDIEIPHSLGFRTAHLTRKGESPSEVAEFNVSSLKEIEPIVYRAEGMD